MTPGARPADRAVATPPNDPPPFGLYVHFPFCKARCHYCAFYFVVGRAEARRAYVDAVAAEIARRSADPRFAGRRLHSLYFGGGTPSLLAPDDVARLAEAAARAFPFADGVEISLESNPDGLDLARLRGLRAAGVNRLTLGWQSLRAAGLRALTRTHTAEENLEALELARAAGFDNVAVDLIFGRPGQTAADWRAELSEAAGRSVDHLSAYELTFEEGTRLARRFREGRFVPADDDARCDMFEAVEGALAPHGLRRYEISNFAREGRECRHNLASWQGGDTLGVGASAASHVANARWTNVADLDEYVRRAGVEEDLVERHESLDEETWAAEDLYLALRTRLGVNVTARLARVPEPARGRLAAALALAEAEGLLGRDGARSRLSPKGLLVCDSILQSLLP